MQTDRKQTEYRPENSQRQLTVSGLFAQYIGYLQFRRVNFRGGNADLRQVRPRGNAVDRLELLVEMTCVKAADFLGDLREAPLSLVHQPDSPVHLQL